MRRMTTWLAMLGGSLALVVAACGGSSTGSAVPATVGQASIPPTAAASVAEPSLGASASASGVAIPSFVLPNDDKGLEALLPDQLCGKKATKLSMSGDRFGQVPDETFSDTLAKIGKSPKDVAFAISTAGLANTDCKENAAVFQIKGADPGRFRDVFIAAAKEQDNTTYTTGNVGGKDVYIGTKPGDDTKTYAYFKGDALFFVQATDDAAAAPLLQVMP